MALPEKGSASGGNPPQDAGLRYGRRMMLHRQIDVESLDCPIQAAEQPCDSFRFGRHIAFPLARELVCDGVPVDIGGRAFDLLLVLLERRGELVDKKEIFNRVWPTTTVEESNLRFQMAVLRKALTSDRDMIKTITGRGYLFVRGERPARAAARPFIVAEMSFDSDPQRPHTARDALRTFLSALRGNPEGVLTLENMLRG